MRIVVVGADGFVGANLADHLLRHTPHDLVTVGAGGRTHRIAPSGRRRLVEVAEPTEHPLFERCDAVVDLVGPVHGRDGGTGWAQEHRRAAHAARVIDRCTAAGAHLVRRVDAGRPLHAVDEDHPTTWVRTFDVVGPRLDRLDQGATAGARVVAELIAALLTSRPMQLVDGGHQRRSPTHVADACRAIVALLVTGAPGPGPIDIGNPGNDTTIREVAVLLRDLWTELTGRTPAAGILDVTGGDDRAFGDHARMLPDTSRLDELGWAPRSDLETTMRDTLASYLRPTPLAVAG
ncbi:MAG: NAD-dependent epimerase/dehydratase family protein [Actinomycetota bacterium]|nr:NAD-dependent epimerase/dehydratase family protein [Actinomycetota bacterium]